MRLGVACAAIGLAALLGVLLAVGVGAQSSPITLEQRTTSSLSVRWHWGGQTAAAFEVAWRPRGEDDRAAWRSARKQASERRHTISGLDAGVHYVVRVRALNAAGRPLGDLRAAFATDWSAPRLLRVTARADAALTIGWSAPTDWSPQGYRLRWRAAGAQTLSGDLTLPASADSRRLPGLSTGTAYLIRLTALNARGGESPPAVLTATAAGAPPAQPVLTDASWSELTLRAEWDAVARATGYDVRWNSADDQTPVSAEEAIETSPAEYAAPRTGLYTVAVRARIGSGPTAVRGEWSQPLSLRVLPAPGYLRVQNFDGERVRLSWPGVGANGYVVEWGRRGGTKQTETRDGRSGVLEVGPLTVIAAYEFRVRARHQRGESGWSPTATMTPTIWPQLPPRAALNQGSLYVLWPPAAGAEWYEAQWINAADRAETARVRVAPPGGGGNVAARIGRDGGFEDGRWLVRVRAGPFGLWSQTYALDLAGQPPRLALELESSRDLCTAGTLTEVSWKISGGSAPYALSVENSAVDVSADNVRVNCGALTEAEAGDAEAALAAKTVSAVVTDSRGVQRTAALDVARARALHAPIDLDHGSQFETVTVTWEEVDSSLSSDAMVRYRPIDGAKWTYIATRDDGAHSFEPPTGEHMASVAVVRHPLELETPDALVWSEEVRCARVVAAQNLTVAATHDTVTVSWDKQPYTAQMPHVRLTSPSVSGSVSDRVFEVDGEYGRHEVVFKHVLPSMDYVVRVVMSDGGVPRETGAAVRTAAAPSGWTPPPRGPQNLRATAASDGIAVTWGHPHDRVRANYVVQLIDEHSGDLLNLRWISTRTNWTIRSSLNGAPLRPGRQYRIHVKLMTFGLPADEVVVRMPAAPAAASGAADAEAQREPLLLPFFPRWPVSIDGRYAMTDDPFEWRDGRYHAGLDIGEHGGGEYGTPSGPGDVSGDAVYAVEDGILRLFGNEQGVTVLYCHDDSLPLHRRFHESEDKWGSAWWTGTEMYKGGKKADRDVFCDDVISPAAGRAALITHTLRGGQGVVTKYGHLASATRDVLEALGVHADCFDSKGEVKS